MRPYTQVDFICRFSNMESIHLGTYTHDTNVVFIYRCSLEQVLLYIHHVDAVRPRLWPAFKWDNELLVYPLSLLSWLYYMYIAEIYSTCSVVSLWCLTWRNYHNHEIIWKLSSVIPRNMIKYSSPPLIRTPFLPNNYSSSREREVSFGEEHHVHYCYFVDKNLCPA